MSLARARGVGGRGGRAWSPIRAGQRLGGECERGHRTRQEPAESLALHPVQRPADPDRAVGGGRRDVDARVGAREDRLLELAGPQSITTTVKNRLSAAAVVFPAPPRTLPTVIRRIVVTGCRGPAAGPG